MEKDPEREDRIVMEAIVDAYGPEEQAMGWYYYLQDRIAAPFAARCVEERAVLETLTGIKRAGADLLITYHALDAARWLAEGRTA